MLVSCLSRRSFDLLFWNQTCERQQRGFNIFPSVFNLPRFSDSTFPSTDNSNYKVLRFFLHRVWNPKKSTAEPWKINQRLISKQVSIPWEYWSAVKWEFSAVFVWKNLFCCATIKSERKQNQYTTFHAPHELYADGTIEWIYGQRLSALLERMYSFSVTMLNALIRLAFNDSEKYFLGTKWGNLQ